MKSRRLPILATVLGVLIALPVASVSAQEDVQGKIVAIEKELWEGWKNKDMKPFEKHMTKDTVNINAQGLTSGKAQVIASITGANCDVKSYSLGEMKVQRLGKDAAMLTYSASQDATCGGEKIPASVLVSSTYVNEGGAWKSTSYHESPVTAPK